MTPRERVLAVLNHQIPDKIVTELGSTECTAIAREAYASVKQYLGVKKKDRLMRWDMQLSFVDDEVLQYLGTDFRGVSAHPNFPIRTVNEREYYDHFGIRYRMPINGYYYDMVENPLSNMESLEEIKQYQWPSPIVPGAVTGCKERARVIRDENQYALIGDITNSGLFEPCHYLRGFENFLADLIVDEEICHYLLEHMLQYQCARWDQFLGEVGEYVDIVFVGDDLGSTKSLLMSPDTYRRIIKPYQKRYFAYIKERTNHAKLMYHSCGSIISIIPDLIEIGVDVLNPIQVNANGMDTKILKEKFGKNLCFCGAVDTSWVLPNGSEEDVRAEVERRIEDLGPDGFILAAVHDIQVDVPAKNTIEMFKAAKEHRISGEWVTA